VNEIAGKLVDALSMFWQSLDEQEKRIVLYLGCYFAVTTALAYARARRERMIAELREELAHGAVA
jgi:hypothetical protein